MSDVPITHFSPREVDVSWQTLHSLGLHMISKEHLSPTTSKCWKFFPQDFIVSKAAGDFFVRTAQFIDELLVRYYGLEPYYNVDTPDDLVGHLICALCTPHLRGSVE